MMLPYGKDGERPVLIILSISEYLHVGYEIY